MSVPDIPDHLVTMAAQSRLTVLTGPPKSGKVKLFNKLVAQLPYHEPIMTDEFIDVAPVGRAFPRTAWDAGQATHKALKQGKRVVLEGVMVPRLLLNDTTLTPDLFIMTECAWPTIEYCYHTDGEEYKLPKVKGFYTKLHKDVLDYRFLYMALHGRELEYHKIDTNLPEALLNGSKHVDRCTKRPGFGTFGPIDG